MMSRTNLDSLDEAYKAILIVGFILMLVVAAAVTNDTATKPLTGSQVAAVGFIAVFLLFLGALVYNQFPDSILGKPKKESQKSEVKEKS
ncbi:hypothetical protein [Acidianus sp. RZ1]|uniref:hypothetical protein n=1 Tax=Acidianus sp. RZ1 TaxID=1540082 RepID=UPI0020A46C93|nr:hypothetical protein [Acidianus sp. RZ1]